MIANMKFSVWITLFIVFVVHHIDGEPLDLIVSATSHAGAGLEHLIPHHDAKGWEVLPVQEEIGGANFIGHNQDPYQFQSNGLGSTVKFPSEVRQPPPVRASPADDPRVSEHQRQAALQTHLRGFTGSHNSLHNSDLNTLYGYGYGSGVYHHTRLTGLYRHGKADIFSPQQHQGFGHRSNLDELILQQSIVKPETLPVVSPEPSSSPHFELFNPLWNIMSMKKSAS